MRRRAHGGRRVGRQIGHFWRARDRAPVGGRTYCPARRRANLAPSAKQGGASVLTGSAHVMACMRMSGADGSDGEVLMARFCLAARRHCDSSAFSCVACWRRMRMKSARIA